MQVDCTTGALQQSAHLLTHMLDGQTAAGEAAVPASGDAPFAIRGAEAVDAALVYGLAKELVDFEGLGETFQYDLPTMRKYLFEVEHPYAHALLAFDVRTGRLAGQVIYLFSFSTFTGRPTLYLEDIFVRPEYRRSGCARRLFTALAEIAVSQGCGRMEWLVQEQNRSAVTFYERMGGAVSKDWVPFVIEQAGLQRLAAGHRGAASLGPAD